MSLDEDFRTLVFKYGITSVIEYAEIFVKQSCEEINKIHTRLFLKGPIEIQNVVKEISVKVEEQIAPPTINDTKELVKINNSIENDDIDALHECEEQYEEKSSEDIPKKPKKCIKKRNSEEKSEEKPNEKLNQTINENTQEVSDKSTIDDSSDKIVSIEDEKKRKEEEKREQNRIAKRKQTEAQRKTFEENKSKGINPYDMLTKVNLEKWLIKEERTYADIAQNIVGCSDKDVSLAAKRFDVKSLYIGENGMIKVGRKKKKTIVDAQ